MTITLAAADLDLTRFIKRGDRIVMGQACGEPSTLLAALIALALYGLLPVVRATIAGIESVPASVREIALGLGMGGLGTLLKVELPLALPVVLTGVRTSVIVNLGTAAIASTVGAKTLGSPIIVGLSGFNTAYVLQGAILVGGLAVVTDMAFGRLAEYLDRWRPQSR